MSNIREPNPTELEAWEAWLADRPAVIQEMARKYPPWKLYRISSGHRVTLHSYAEDGTVTVIVSGKYNFVSFERRVFGIAASQLVECEPPSPDEKVGSLDMPIERVREWFTQRN